MKKQYTTPNILVVRIATAKTTMITGSSVSEERLSSGTDALSRRNGGSFWDDEEDY